MTVETIYTIEEAKDVVYRTSDPDRAESAARAGMTVKAETRRSPI